MTHFVLGSRFYFSRLSDYEKTIYREIYGCWVTGSSIAKTTFPGSGFQLPSGMELHLLVDYVIQDNPHIFHLETTQVHYSRQGTSVTIQLENIYTPEEYKQVYANLKRRVSQIEKMAEYYQTDYERLRFLHDYLAENITYDKGANDPKSQREVHTIVGALLKSACVCDGYSRAFRLLCDQLHLSCIVAIGDIPASSERHAWNFVRLNGNVYHVDVTWDSNLVASGCPVTDYYFLRNDAIFSQSHNWDSSLYPTVKMDYPRKERIISTKWELESYICGEVQNGKKDMLVLFDDSFPGSDTLQNLLKKIMNRNPIAFIKIGGCQSTYYDSIKTAAIHFY